MELVEQCHLPREIEIEARQRSWPIERRSRFTAGLYCPRGQLVETTPIISRILDSTGPGDSWPRQPPQFRACWTQLAPGQVDRDKPPIFAHIGPARGFRPRGSS